jgi:hypothetical protein
VLSEPWRQASRAQKVPRDLEALEDLLQLLAHLPGVSRILIGESNDVNRLCGFDVIIRAMSHRHSSFPYSPRRAMIKIVQQNRDPVLKTS